MLDNKKISPSLLSALRNIPNEDFTRKRHLTRETKILIYDRNCGKCGFKRIAVNIDGKITEHKTILDAISYLSMNGNYNGGCEIIRSCSYPGNVESTDEEIIYPTITEIVMNTCRLWNPINIESNDEVVEEIQFEESFETSDRSISEYRRDGKILHNEIIPK